MILECITQRRTSSLFLLSQTKKITSTERFANCKGFLQANSPKYKPKSTGNLSSLFCEKLTNKYHQVMKLLFFFSFCIPYHQEGWGTSYFKGFLHRKSWCGFNTAEVPGGKCGVTLKTLGRAAELARMASIGAS